MLRSIALFFLCVSIGATLMIGYARLIHPTEVVKQSPTQRQKTVPFSVNKAPSATLKGKITQLNGTVMWVSRIATDEAQITHLQAIEQGEQLSTKKDGFVAVEFPNQFGFSLLHDTTVAILQTLPNHIVLNQNTGMATYTALAPHSLSVRSGPLLMRLDTGKATVGIDVTRVITIASGSATIAYNDSNQTTTLVPIHQGQTFRFDDDTRTSSVR